MKLKTLFILFGLFATSGLLLAACQPQEVQVVKTIIVTETITEAGETIVVTKIVEVPVTVEPEEPALETKSVTINTTFGAEPPNADPALATDTTSITVVANLFMGLTRQDGATFEIKPYLATEWEAGEDADGNQTWTFNLRDDIPWVHYDPMTGETTQEVDDEGNPRFVNAHDVVYGVKRTIDPATGSGYAYVLYLIKNAQAVNISDENFTLDQVGVEALDDHTVQFTLEHPGGYFPAIASMWVAMPQPQWIIEDELYGPDWTEAGVIVTNGPYLMESWIHGGELNFVKNPLWPEADSVQIERIEAPIITEASLELTMYENNELDTARVPLTAIDRAKSDPVLGTEFSSIPSDCTYYYGFVNNKPPMDDVRVRRAFSAAIDRQSLVDNVAKGGHLPATSFGSPYAAGAPAPGTVGQGYDPGLAKASFQDYLDEMGMTIDEFNKKYNLTLMHNISEGQAQNAAAIQQVWTDTLGADVDTEVQEWGIYITTIGHGTPIEEVPHIFSLGWCGDYPDENNWVHEVFNSEAGRNTVRRNCLDNNCTEATNSEFDDLTVAAQLEQDPVKRAELYARAEHILAVEEAAYAPLLHMASVAVTKPWLTRTFTSYAYWPDWSIDWETKQAATQ